MLGKHTGLETNVPSKPERGQKLLFMSLWGSEGGGPQGAEKEQEWSRWLRTLGQQYEVKESWEECVSTTHYRVALDRGAGTGYTG